MSNKNSENWDRHLTEFWYKFDTLCKNCVKFLCMSKSCQIKRARIGTFVWHSFDTNLTHCVKTVSNFLYVKFVSKLCQTNVPILTLFIWHDFDMCQIYVELWQGGVRVLPIKEWNVSVIKLVKYWRFLS